MDCIFNSPSQVIHRKGPKRSGLFKGLRFAGLFGLTLSASMALTGQAIAGCGLTLTFDNDMKKLITILGVESKTTGGKYKNVYSKDFKVAGGKKKTKAIETNAGCALPHHLRVKYEKGKNTLYKTKGPLATAFDKKYTFEFDD